METFLHLSFPLKHTVGKVEFFGGVYEGSLINPVLLTLLAPFLALDLD